MKNVSRQSRANITEQFTSQKKKQEISVKKNTICFFNTSILVESQSMLILEAGEITAIKDKYRCL